MGDEEDISIGELAARVLRDIADRLRAEAEFENRSLFPGNDSISCAFQT